MFSTPNLLDNANKVLLQSYWDKSKAPDPNQKLPKAQSKNHWSFYVLEVGALAAAVAIVAGAILGNLGLILGGSFYLLTTCIGAYYVHRFGAEQVFESYVQIFTQRVSQITQDILALTNDNGNLKKELSALNSEIAKSQKILIDNAKELEQASGEIGRHTENLEKEAPLAEKFLSLIGIYKNENSILQQKLDQLAIESKQLNSSKVDLENRVKDLSDQNQKLSSELNTYTQANDTYHQQNQQLQTLIDDLKQQLKNVATSLPKLPSAPKVNEDKNVKDITSSVNKIEQDGKQLNSVIDEAEKLLDALLNSNKN